jgi:uncharacterized membrane protein required for colicin V production
MTVTDFATCVLSFYFLVRGAMRGFFNSLIFPVSIIVATILSAVYFKMTNDMTVSLAIGLIGPFLLCFLLKFIFNIWLKAINSDIKQPLLLSRLAGAALTFIWGWIFIIFTLILLVVLPPWGGILTQVHDDVVKSSSYLYIAKPIKEAFSPEPKQIAAADLNGSNAKDDARSLAEDPRFQKIMQDPEVQKDIDTHDIAKLMSNPKMMALVQQIMSDPQTMKRVLAIYKNQAQAQPAQNP